MEELSYELDKSFGLIRSGWTLQHTPWKEKNASESKTVVPPSTLQVWFRLWQWWAANQVYEMAPAGSQEIGEAVQVKVHELVASVRPVIRRVDQHIN